MDPSSSQEISSSIWYYPCILNSEIHTTERNKSFNLPVPQQGLPTGDCSIDRDPVTGRQKMMVERVPPHFVVVSGVPSLALCVRRFIANP